MVGSELEEIVKAVVKLQLMVVEGVGEEEEEEGKMGVMSQSLQ